MIKKVRRRNLRENLNNKELSDFVQYVNVGFYRSEFADALCSIVESIADEHGLTYRREEDDYLFDVDDNSYVYFGISYDSVHMYAYDDTTKSREPDRTAYADFSFEWDKDINQIGLFVKGSINREKFSNFVTNLFDLKSIFESIFEVSYLI
jgi:hypothetical protein